MTFILTAVDKDETISQRRMASELGIAVGLVNSYVKRCVRKGLLKVREVPHRRYAYYLTPKGFAEKSRLTAEYLSTSLSFFRRARLECAAVIGHARVRGWTRLALVGAGDLSEIAVLCALEQGSTIIGIIDPARAGEKVTGIDVVGSNSRLIAPVDAYIITSIEAADGLLGAILADASSDRVLAPALLGLKTLAPLPLSPPTTEAA